MDIKKSTYIIVATYLAGPYTIAAYIRIACKYPLYYIGETGVAWDKKS